MLSRTNASAVCTGAREDVTGSRASSPRYEKRRLQAAESGLRRWLRDEKWVNVCERDARGAYAPCGRAEFAATPSAYPYCRPSARASPDTPTTAHELSQSQIRRMCTKKRAAEGAPRAPGDRRPTRVRLAE